MALAIRYEELLREGSVEDQANFARLGHAARARITQIMNLLLLAPDVQDATLNLPRTVRGRAPIVETHLHGVVVEVDWSRQGRRCTQIRDQTG